VASLLYPWPWSSLEPPLAAFKPSKRHLHPNNPHAHQPHNPSARITPRQLPNGEVTSDQLRYLTSVLEPLGEHGCADITTRANLQVGRWGLSGGPL